jgi:hypothetical protein
MFFGIGESFFAFSEQNDDHNDDYFLHQAWLDCMACMRCAFTQSTKDRITYFITFECETVVLDRLFAELWDKLCIRGAKQYESDLFTANRTSTQPKLSIVANTAWRAYSLERTVPT